MCLLHEIFWILYILDSFIVSRLILHGHTYFFGLGSQPYLCDL
jgi:hypothetical protein